MKKGVAKYVDTCKDSNNNFIKETTKETRREINHQEIKKKGRKTYRNESMYDDIVFTSIPHASAREVKRSGECTLCAPEIISSP